MLQNKIISRDQVQSILNRKSAQVYGDSLVHEAAARAKEIEDAHAKIGLEQGLEEGRKIYAQSLDAINTAFQKSNPALIKNLSRVVILALKKILAELPPDKLIQDCVSKALLELNPVGPCAVMVSATDFAHMSDHLTATRKDAKSLTVEVKVDPLLKQGEAVVDSIFGRMHVSAAQQLQLLEASLEKPY